jgi:hypothetical protein
VWETQELAWRIDRLVRRMGAVRSRNQIDEVRHVGPDDVVHNSAGDDRDFGG